MKILTFIIIAAILFLGYLMSTSEDEGATQSSSSKKEFVKQNPPLIPDIGSVKNESESLPLPINGKTHSFAQGKRPAVLKVNTKGGDHHLIKLTKPGSTEAVMYLFIRAGQSAEMEVPLGTFEIKWATGKEWYGYKKKFGESTAYGKADKLFNFEQTITQTSTGYTTTMKGREITLYPVTSGNLSTKTISADEF